MVQVIDSIALVLTASVLGAMVFFAFVMAPMIFTRLPETTAGPFIRSVFPVYYLALGACSLAAGTLLLVSGAHVSAALLLTVAGGFVLARQVLMPRINALRDRSLDGDDVSGRRFERWHRASVALNGTQLVIVLVTLLRLG